MTDSHLATRCSLSSLHRDCAKTVLALPDAAMARPLAPATLEAAVFCGAAGYEPGVLLLQVAAHAVRQPRLVNVRTFLRWHVLADSKGRDPCPEIASSEWRVAGRDREGGARSTPADGIPYSLLPTRHSFAVIEGARAE